MSRGLRIGAPAAALAALALGGCQSLPWRKAAEVPAPPPAPAAVAEAEPAPAAERSQPQPQPPIVRSCVPRTLGPPPRYPDSDGALRAAAGAADRYQLMAAGRLMRQRRLEELERVVAGCR